jgi:hypothetical protein
MRALHIDAAARQVREVQLPDRGSQIKALHALVGGYIEVAHRFPNGDVMFVDEEGLLKGPEHFFDIGAHQPFAGNGVIVGPEIRERPTPAGTQVGEIEARVRWLTIDQVRAR